MDDRRKGRRERECEYPFEKERHPLSLVILKMFRLSDDKKIGYNNGVSEVANA